MHEFIGEAASALGVPEAKARSATAGLLGLIQQNAEASDFSALAERIPGLGDLAASGGAKTEAATGGGLMGMATGALSGLGGSVGGAASLLSIFEKSGISSDQAGSFVSMLVGYLQKEGGADLVGKLLSSVPELRKLAG